jgi:hypothetical protein
MIKMVGPERSVNEDTPSITYTPILDNDPEPWKSVDGRLPRERNRITIWVRCAGVHSDLVAREDYFGYIKVVADRARFHVNYTDVAIECPLPHPRGDDHKVVASSYALHRNAWRFDEFGGPLDDGLDARLAANWIRTRANSLYRELEDRLYEAELHDATAADYVELERRCLERHASCIDEDRNAPGTRAMYSATGRTGFYVDGS